MVPAGRRAGETHPRSSTSAVKYYNGEGVCRKTTVKAVKWYRLAAGQGDASAQLNLGVMYSTGEGVPQDYGEAVKWYRLAAGQGERILAQFNLGLKYAQRRGRATKLHPSPYVAQPCRG